MTKKLSNEGFTSPLVLLLLATTMIVSHVKAWHLIFTEISRSLTRQGECQLTESDLSENRPPLDCEIERLDDYAPGAKRDKAPRVLCALAPQRHAFEGRLCD